MSAKYCENCGGAKNSFWDDPSWDKSCGCQKWNFESRFDNYRDEDKPKHYMEKFLGTKDGVPQYGFVYQQEKKLDVCNCGSCAFSVINGIDLSGDDVIEIRGEFGKKGNVCPATIVLNKAFLYNIVNGGSNRACLLGKSPAHSIAIAKKIVAYFYDLDRNFASHNPTKLCINIGDARIDLFSTYEPHKFCGAQFDSAWVACAPENCQKERYREAYDNMIMCLRLLPNPKLYKLTCDVEYWEDKQRLGGEEADMGKYDYLIAKEIERLNDVQKARYKEKELKAGVSMHDEAMAELKVIAVQLYDVSKVFILGILGLIGLFLGCVQVTTSVVVISRVGSNYLFNIELLLGLTNIIISCILITLSRIGLKVYEDK